MTQYAFRRFILLFPTLFAMSLALFVVIRVLPPQDAIDRQLGEQGQIDSETKDILKKQLGLDGSLSGQYVRWLGNVLTGDLGRSIHTRR